jgi:ssDNA-binding Zn-finger/Zn-ribbon topoisomerase 1
MHHPCSKYPQTPSFHAVPCLSCAEGKKPNIAKREEMEGRERNRVGRVREFENRKTKQPKRQGEKCQIEVEKVVVRSCIVFLKVESSLNAKGEI